MSKDNKKLMKYLGILFIAVLLTYKLPHDSYSIIQYIIPPIRSGNSVTYISGIFSLVLFIIGISGLLKLERFMNKSKLLLFMAIIIIILPLMKWTLDVSRTNYYWIKGDGLKAVDIETADISLNGSTDEMKINITLKLKDYSRKDNEFKIRVYLPQSLEEYAGKEFLELENTYRTHGNRNIINIEEDIVIKFKSYNK